MESKNNYKLKIMFRSNCRLNKLFRFEDPLEKKIHSGIIIAIRVVTARLLIIGKPSATFVPERLNTWGSPILQENDLKT